jgi:hypothetical protein
MRRKLFTLAAAISLVLCLAVAWTWRHPRSSGGVRHTIMEFSAGARVVELSEVSDLLILGWLPGDHRQIEAQTPPPGMSNQRSLWGLPGIGAVISVRIWTGQRAVGIIAADWFVVFLTALLPLVWGWRGAVSSMRRWVRTRRSRLGLCVRCAYDLRGTPGRCPECGEVPELAPQSPHNPPLQRTAAAV